MSMRQYGSPNKYLIWRTRGADPLVRGRRPRRPFWTRARSRPGGRLQTRGSAPPDRWSGILDYFRRGVDAAGQGRGRLLFVLALTTLVPAAFAQQRAQVLGTITDATGAILAGAQVSVINEANGIRRGTRSNQEGGYAVASLQPGSYKITVRRDGFQTVARLGVDLDKNRAARVDFTLPLGSMQEVITIEGGTPLVNAEDAAVGTTVDRDLVENLPLNGHALQALFDLSPGVVTTPATAGEAGQFAVNGQRANTNYFYVDGVSANTGVSGAGLPGEFAGSTMPGMSAIGSLHNLVTLEEVQEVRLQTSTFAPEFGRMPGAQISVSTSSGSNTLHGSLFENFRHERLSASDWFANSAGLNRGKLRLNDFGAALGGPIQRNRTFFFASYEYLSLRQPETWRLAVPSLAVRDSPVRATRMLLDAFPIPNGLDLGNGQSELTAQSSRPSRLSTTSVRLDQAVGSRASGFARYTEGPSASQFGFFELNDARFRWRSLTLGATAALSGTLTNDARLNVGQAEVKASWMDNSSGGAQPPDLASILPPLYTGQNVVYGFSIGGLGQFLSGGSGLSKQGQLYFADTMALSGVKHQMRFGVQYQRLTPSRDQTASSEVGSFSSLQGLLKGEPMMVTTVLASQAASVIETFSAFAQDTWRIGSRANVTYGARWEVTPAPALRGAQPAMPVVNVGSSLPVLTTASAEPVWPTRYTQFAPRLGIAYRLTPEGSFVLRAGAGVFYDLGFSSATDLVNGAPYNSFQGLSVGLAPIVGFRSLRYGFAPNLRLPRSVEWNVAIERQLAGTDVATISYIGSAGHNLLRREAYLQPDNQSTETVLATNQGWSDYHALQAQYRRRLARGLRGVATYTWSHSIDNGSWDSSLMLVYPGSAARDRGSSNFDVRHAATLAMAYDLPRTRGWSVDGILRARTGFPIDVLSAENSFGLGFDNAIRPNLLPGAPIWLGRRLNRDAFSLPDSGAEGSLGRNAIAGFGMYQIDLALRKHFVVLGDRSLQFRVDAFNVTNHVDFADPVRFLSSGLFGQSVSLLNQMLGTGSPHSGLTPAFQAGGPRSVQLGLQLRF
jgi:hypothetical protein